MEGHDGPDELAAAKPRVTKGIRMKGLHHDDRSPADASGFRQHTSGVVWIGEHEQEQRSRERFLLERKCAISDQHRCPPHDVDVAHVSCDYHESQLALQPGRDVSGSRAKVQHGALIRQPRTHLLGQLTRAPFHDGVK